MSNIYMTWTQLKTKKNAEGKTLYYHQNEWNWQIYVLDGPDVYIHYIPRPDKFSEMVIDSANQTQAQADYDDFNTNYKANAIETEGVAD